MSTSNQLYQPSLYQTWQRLDIGEGAWREGCWRGRLEGAWRGGLERDVGKGGWRGGLERDVGERGCRGTLHLIRNPYAQPVSDDIKNRQLAIII